LLFLCGVITLAVSEGEGVPWILNVPGASRLRWLFAGTLALSALHLAIRTGCSARIYGVRFACGVPLRAVLGNWLNLRATVQEIGRFFMAKVRKRPLVWLKTEHMYPSRSALMVHKRRLGEILVARGVVNGELLETAVRHKPAEERLGEYLMRM